jgi:hypothetical protein
VVTIRAPGATSTTRTLPAAMPDSDVSEHRTSSPNGRHAGTLCRKPASPTSSPSSHETRWVTNPRRPKGSRPTRNSFLSLESDCWPPIHSQGNSQLDLDHNPMIPCTSSAANVSKQHTISPQAHTIPAELQDSYSVSQPAVTLPYFRHQRR